MQHISSYISIYFLYQLHQSSGLTGKPSGLHWKLKIFRPDQYGSQCICSQSLTAKARGQRLDPIKENRGIPRG